VLEGDDARHAVDEESRATTSRQSLGRHPGFSDISPELGVLDEEAFDRALSADADDALGLLADLIGATDERLRAKARQLAARIVLEVGQRGPIRRRGSGQRRLVPADRAEGDLDLDASLDALVLARATGQPPALDDLRVETWSRPVTAICLVVDRSGSMGGERLATAAIGAAACAWRAGVDLSVMAFSDSVIVVKAQDEPRPAALVAEDVLRLRGRGVTDLGLALSTAQAQLARSNASRRVVVLLSDCRPTAGADPGPIAASLDELCILAPADDHDDAVLLARVAGARWAPIDGPSSLPGALRTLLDP
jgi:Mg-chelatase subunit ChlD